MRQGEEKGKVKSYRAARALLLMPWPCGWVQQPADTWGRAGEFWGGNWQGWKGWKCKNA